MAASIFAREILFLASACVLLLLQGADAAHAHTYATLSPTPRFPSHRGCFRYRQTESARARVFSDEMQQQRRQFADA